MEKHLKTIESWKPTTYTSLVHIANTSGMVEFSAVPERSSSLRKYVIDTSVERALPPQLSRADRVDKISATYAIPRKKRDHVLGIEPVRKLPLNDNEVTHNGFHSPGTVIPRHVSLIWRFCSGTASRYSYVP